MKLFEYVPWFYILNFFLLAGLTSTQIMSLQLYQTPVVIQETN